MYISVIVPVYKVEEEYLTVCLDSLMKQKGDEIEFIIIDDGSPDNCGNICDKYAERDPRFKVIHTPNKGVSHARNVGISNSKGNYVLFVDGDDYIDKNLCGTIIERYNDVNKFDIVLFRFEERNNTVFQNESDLFCPDLEFVNNMRCFNVSQREERLGLNGFRIGSPWGKIINRDFINRNSIRFVEGIKKSQDRLFMFDCLASTEKIAYWDIMGYHYVLRGDSITHRYNPNIEQIISGFTRELEKRVSSDPTKYDDDMNELTVELVIEVMMLYLFKTDNPMHFGQSVKKLKVLAKQPRYVKGIKKIKLSEYNLKRKIILICLKLRCYYSAGFFARIFFGK